MRVVEADPAGRWGRRRRVRWWTPRRAVGVLALAAALTSLGGRADGQSEGAIPWRDPAAALDHLADAESRLLDARDELAAAHDAIADLGERRADISEESLDLAADMQDALSRARRLAVEAYMSGGALPEAMYLLDAATASELAYRSTLLSEGADVVADSSQEYEALRADATAETRELAAELDRRRRSVDDHEQRVVDAEAAVKEAQFVVAVSEIHARADGAFARTGRPEPTPEQWAALRHCESTDRYGAHTGNGFYGAYQFTLGTWTDLGGSGLPSSARPEEQDARARLLYSLRGAQPWPVCGFHLPG